MHAWRTPYHEHNIDRLLPIDDLACNGCGLAFQHDERITMINDDPYCSTDCFFLKQTIDETWGAEPEPTADDVVRERMNKFTEHDKELLRWFAQLHQLPISI